MIKGVDWFRIPEKDINLLAANKRYDFVFDKETYGAVNHEASDELAMEELLDKSYKITDLKYGWGTLAELYLAGKGDSPLVKLVFYV